MGLEGLMNAGYVQQLRKKVEELEKRIVKLEQKASGK